MLLAVTGDPVVPRRGSGCSRGAVGHGGLGPELLTGGLNLSGSLRRSLPDQVRPLLHLLLLQLGGRWLSRPRCAGAWKQPVVDLNDGGVIDQVQALEVDTAHMGAEQVLELGDELVLVADGPVEGDDLVAVRRMSAGWSPTHSEARMRAMRMATMMRWLLMPPSRPRARAAKK